MNASDRSEAADSAAALWAARLEGGGLSAADRNALEAWLEDDPAHRALLSEYCQFSADLEPRLAALAAAGVIEMPPPASRHSRWAVFGTAGMALAAAAVAVALWVRPAPDSFNAVGFAPSRQVQQITLGDGSRVDLNAGSALRVELRADSRQVQLDEGEAYFQVERDPGRPFIVQTANGTVRVTGTRFNVRAEPDGELEVTVLEGSVEVTPRGNRMFALGKGDRLLSEGKTVSHEQLSSEALLNSILWKDGLLVLENVPLKRVAARIARHHGVRIEVDPAVRSLTFTGANLALEDLGGLLRDIDLLSDEVSITRDPDIIRISKTPVP